MELFFQHTHKNNGNDSFCFEEEKRREEEKKKKREREKPFLWYSNLVASKLGTWLGVFLKEDLYQYLFSQVMFLLHDIVWRWHFLWLFILWNISIVVIDFKTRNDSKIFHADDALTHVRKCPQLLL